MAFAGETLSEYFDTDDFDDCVSVSYTPASGVPITTNLFLTERSGLLEDGTVRSAYFEVDLNRQQVPTPQIGDTFDDGTYTYKISGVVDMDNDIAHCEADKTG